MATLATATEFRVCYPKGGGGGKTEIDLMAGLQVAHYLCNWLYV